MEIEQNEMASHCPSFRLKSTKPLHPFSMAKSNNEEEEGEENNNDAEESSSNKKKNKKNNQASSSNFYNKLFIPNSTSEFSATRTYQSYETLIHCSSMQRMFKKPLSALHVVPEPEQESNTNNMSSNSLDY